MRLKYKISLIMALIGMFVFTSISYIYSSYSYNEVIKDQKDHLLGNAVNTANYIEIELNEKLSITKTIGTAPIVFESLSKSNKEYQNLTDVDKNNRIQKLNNRWKKSKDDKDDFIQQYLSNQLALYLKKQQKTLPGVYGEIFITNLYGAMIATTGKLSTLAHSHKYWWKESYNDGKGKSFFDDRGFDKSVDGYVIGIVIPIKKDGNIIGILKANVNIMGSLHNITKYYSKLKHGDLQIVRTKGLVVLDKNNAPLSTTIDSNLITSLKSMKKGSKTLEDDILAYAPVELTLNSSEISFGSKPSSIDHAKGNEDEAWHTVITYGKDEALRTSTEINNMIIYVGIMITLLLLIMAYFVGKWVSMPINILSKTANRISDGEIDLRAEIQGGEEISKLAYSFNNMLEKLNETMASRDELKDEIERREKVEQDLKEKESIIIAQSQQAARGDMTVMIAHQWRQPLSVIGMGINNIMVDIDLDIVDNKILKQDMSEIMSKIQDLSQTIEDFQNSFRTDQNVEEILIEDTFNEIFKIVERTLIDNNIEISTHYNNKKISTYSRELLQVLLNIIKNSNDVFTNSNIKDKKISINIVDSLNKVTIKICDNGGGIPEDIILQIFNPYFTTKYNTNGTGLGLYLSKTIIEKHLNGTIDVYNKNDGVCFEIKLPYKIDL